MAIASDKKKIFQCLASLFIILISFTPVSSTTTQIPYTYGIIRLAAPNDESSPHSVCMIYPYEEYSLGLTSESYNLFDKSSIDICSTNVTKNDFVPSLPDSVILLTASSNCTNNFEKIIAANTSGVILLLKNNAYQTINESFHDSWKIFSIVRESGAAQILNLTSTYDNIMVQFLGSRSFDLSLLGLITIAVFCVAVGSYTGGGSRRSREVDGSEHEVLGMRPKEENNVNITVPLVLGLVIFISATLILLFYFYKYLVYFFIAVFCLASARAAFSIFSQVVESISPRTFQYKSVFGIGIHHILIGIIAITLPTIWFIYRHYFWVWVIQDILGICFCIHLIQILHLPSLKIITILLGLLFIYDIFFVFITPFLTKDGSSIMVEVATGVSGSGSNETLPMLFKFPRIQENPPSMCIPSRSFSLLGYGDIILPGFLVCYARRFDVLTSAPYSPYFISSLFAYTFGLIGAFVALLISSTGQPALLYIVPSNILVIFIVALLRKEFKWIWNGSLSSSTPQIPNTDGPV